jgi:hypothetical protein
MGKMPMPRARFAAPPFAFGVKRGFVQQREETMAPVVGI